MKWERFLSKAGNTRSIWLLGFVLMLVHSAAFALDPMGPPTAGLRQGQLKEGIEYSYGTMDLKLDDGIWIEHLDGLFYDAGNAEPLTLKNFKTNKAFFTLGYGIIDGLDAFLRLGGATATFGDSIWEDAEKFDNNADFTVGCGIKATFYENDNLKLGGLFQANWAEYDGRLSAAHWAAADLVEISITEIQVAVGPTYKLADHISIYGGPFFHFVVGDLDDEFSEASGGGLLTSKYSWDVDESSNYGGYIGAQVDIAENFSCNIEYQQTESADALSAGLIWRF
jgi:opacity protein-like surface antigen